jgi:hypothetical protein
VSKIPTIGNSDTVGDAKLIRVVLPAKLNDVLEKKHENGKVT